MPKSPRPKRANRHGPHPRLPLGDVLPDAISSGKAPRDIKKELETAHKALAQAGFAFASMLARRKMNLTTITVAVAQVKLCSERLDKMLEHIKEEM